MFGPPYAVPRIRDRGMLGNNIWLSYSFAGTLGVQTHEKFKKPTAKNLWVRPCLYDPFYIQWRCAFKQGDEMIAPKCGEIFGYSKYMLSS